MEKIITTFFTLVLDSSSSLLYLNMTYWGLFRMLSIWDGWRNNFMLSRSLRNICLSQVIATFKNVKLKLLSLTKKKEEKKSVKTCYSKLLKIIGRSTTPCFNLCIIIINEEATYCVIVDLYLQGKVFGAANKCNYCRFYLQICTFLKN